MWITSQRDRATTLLISNQRSVRRQHLILTTTALTMLVTAVLRSSEMLLHLEGHKVFLDGLCPYKLANELVRVATMMMQSPIIPLRFLMNRKWVTSRHCTTLVAARRMRLRSLESSLVCATNAYKTALPNLTNTNSRSRSSKTWRTMTQTSTSLGSLSCIQLLNLFSNFSKPKIRITLVTQASTPLN